MRLKDENIYLRTAIPQFVEYATLRYNRVSGWNPASENLSPSLLNLITRRSRVFVDAPCHPLKISRELPLKVHHIVGELMPHLVARDTLSPPTWHFELKPVVAVHSRFSSEMRDSNSRIRARAICVSADLHSPGGERNAELDRSSRALATVLTDTPAASAISSAVIRRVRISLAVLKSMLKLLWIERH